MAASRMPKIGCAGWSIPSRYATHFGPGDSLLARYATRFDVVEINSSFYRPHQRATYARWAATVPAHFRFSVKLPRTLSHDSGLVGVGPLLDRFLDEVGGLGRTLGALLLQLPPSLVLDTRRAGSFFRALRRRTPVPVVCEPRHASWFSTQADTLLQRHAISRAAVDPARVAAAALPGGAQGWHYWRWHGSPRMYYSDYSDTALAHLATQVAQPPGQAQAPWVIFDNTAHGFAIANALRLKEITTHA
ncbi:DUF72 domain-containing protein [Stenotrophomonas rhizophila]|uniref:DUF72 domain-containing protein n=1 Tax=Stenotrophomonas rhizophila TaxID=216778 RepID=UPI0010BFCE30|nr:DUF72 domain-containing protein [Stenotrophomonas rhizophila]TKK08804.1 DUF72 domain-containing protein [Stenotrophomonas rhizophila]